MIIISYDISDDKIRGRFSKMLTKNGAIRLQYSVYEVNNTKRILDTIIMKIESRFRDKFSGADSILIFTADNSKVIKYGNAIHRDKELLIL
jgi:CRISPR-associated protein Cas2